MKKRILLLLLALPFSVFAGAQPVIIDEATGWFESAFVKWQPVDGAESYHVYYSGEGISNLQIDDQLIRDYGDYFRADVLGLKAGTYTIKVVPMLNGEETEGAETASLNVKAHDRTGFAFKGDQTPGAYKSDGTPKENAVILYITENTKNTISMDVTGANANPCVGLQTILEGFKKGHDTRPLIVRLVGQITDPDYLNKGDIVIENDNNASSYITFEGVGDDAVADGWGIRVKNATNIEIRNIGLMNCNSDEGDDIGLQQNNDHIWVHNCDFFYGAPGGDADQAKGDGALDCKRSTYVTFSYNHFWDNGKCNLLGLSEDSTTGLYVTYHHNWYDHSDSRHPRVRFYSVHVYNNYYDGNAKYGVGATMGSSVFVEANYFRNCKYPILTSMQGSDVYDTATGSNDYSGMPTFSKEDGGSIKAFNNYITGEKRFVPYGSSEYPNSSVDFDAYVAASRDETINDSIVSAYGSNTYNNFDTNTSVMYEYTPDSPETARENVMNNAGRMNGGDFHWTFSNAVDDASYALNTALKAALVNYQTKLVAVRGDTIPSGGNGSGGGGGGDTTSDRIQNFTLSGTTSSFYSISGNLSDSKGTVNYNDLTLTQCLKIESSTLISFTTTQDGTLTLVFNSDFSGKIKVNGISYIAAAGMLTLPIPAGSYEITKDEVANLFYMSVDYVTSTLANQAAPHQILYPNPVDLYLKFSTNETVINVKVYNMAGVLVTQLVPHNDKLDVSHLKSGNYLVRILTRQGLLTQKMIKK